MAAQQAAIGRKGEGEKERRVVHTVAESTAAGTAAADAAAMPAGWRPTRFFGKWKKLAARAAGFEVYWSTMGYYKILTPDTRKRIVDMVIRTTIMKGYACDDFYKGVIASHSDYEAMQAYVGAFVDAFWADFWAQHDGDASLTAGTGTSSAPSTAQPLDAVPCA